MRHASRHLFLQVWLNGSAARPLLTVDRTHSLFASFSSGAEPPDDDSKSPTVSGSTETTKPNLKRKVDAAYRPVYGLNQPHPKISSEMDQYIFKDMKSCIPRPIVSSCGFRFHQMRRDRRRGLRDLGSNDDARGRSCLLCPEATQRISPDVFTRKTLAEDHSSGRRDHLS